MHLSQKRISSYLLFIKRFLASPKTIGALCPSSRFLAKAMVDAAKKGLAEADYILELGSGHGSFTQELLRQGICPSKIISLEMDPELSNSLKKRFPGITLIQGNACYLSSVCPTAFKGKIGAVISGLPMLNIALPTQQSIIESSFDFLKPGGQFIQFTYGYRPSIKAVCFGLSYSLVRRVYRNIPPATIWAYQKSCE